MDTSQVTSTLRCNYQLVLARAIPMLGSLSETSAVGISANRIQNILANTHLEDPGEQPFIHHDLLHMTTLGSFCLNLFFQFLRDHKTENPKCIFYK